MAIYGKLYLNIAHSMKFVKYKWSLALNEPNVFLTMHESNMLQMTKCYTISNLCLVELEKDSLIFSLAPN